MAEPYHYLRCIFRGLVVLGARWVHLLVDADDVYICSEIALPSVDNLMGYLFSPDPSAWHLQQLATGIQTAWNLPYRWVEVISPTGGHRFSPRQPYPKPAPVRVIEGYDTFIHLKRQTGWNIVERWLKKQYPECLALSSGCEAHSVCVRVNGQELPRTNRGRAEQRYAHNWPANLEIRTQAETAEFPDLALLNSKVPISIWVDPPSSGPGQLYWVVAGLAMETTELPECPGLVATVALTTFPLDASQAKIRHGEEYAEVLDQVRWCWLERKATRGTNEEARQVQLLLETGPGQNVRAWATLRTRLQNQPIWPRTQPLDGPPCSAVSLDEIQKARRLIVCPGPVFLSVLEPGDVCLAEVDGTLAQILRARNINAWSGVEGLNWNPQRLTYQILKPEGQPKGPCELLFAGLLHDLHAAPGIGLRAFAYSAYRPPLQINFVAQRIELGRSFLHYRDCHYFAWEEARYFKIAFVCPRAGLQLFCTQAKDTVPERLLGQLRLKIIYLPHLLGLETVFLATPLVRDLGEAGPNTSIFQPGPTPGRTSAWARQVNEHARRPPPDP